LVERLAGGQEVAGSNPVFPTIDIKVRRHGGLFDFQGADFGDEKPAGS
jgi:hypothetical protein